MADSNTNRLISRQTLYKLSSSLNEANFQAQISLNKLYALLAWNDPVPDVIYTEVGLSLIHVRQACNELNMYVFVLSEQSSQ